ncbi:MAG: hypothetical protein LBT95_06875 [Treponema sp.]|jgi:hypothetical protein|nr:hypothetical protein [Treponema sp.]
MKQLAVVFKAALALLILASLAACEGGTFSDPGHGTSGIASGSGGGSSGGGKPAKLSDDASYEEVLDKLDEIIDYCEAHPGPGNDSVKASAQSLRNMFSEYGFESWWNSATQNENDKQELIDAINAYISLLQ